MHRSGGAIERAVLINRLEKQGLTHANASMRVCRALKRGELIDEGQQLSIPS